MICDVNGNSPWDTSHWDSHQYDNILYWEWQCAWQKKMVVVLYNGKTNYSISLSPYIYIFALMIGYASNIYIYIQEILRYTRLMQINVLWMDVIY